jgi:hypothetical protein
MDQLRYDDVSRLPLGGSNLAWVTSVGRRLSYGRMRQTLVSHMMRAASASGCAVLVEYLDGGYYDSYEAVFVELLYEGAARVVMIDWDGSGTPLYRSASLDIEPGVLEDRIRWFSASAGIFFDDESVDINSDSDAVWVIAITSNGTLSRILSSRWRIPRSELGLLSLDRARELGAEGRVGPIVDFAAAVRQALAGIDGI